MTSLSANHLQSCTNENLFNLQLKLSAKTTHIKMFLVSPPVNTKDLPQTGKIISENLPNIYRHKCFNERGLSFSQELKKTQIGHLFEHILMEYMYQIKLKTNFGKVSYSGKTEWNWISEKAGIFNIFINTGLRDQFIMLTALQKSSILLENILLSNPSHTT